MPALPTSSSAFQGIKLHIFYKNKQTKQNNLTQRKSFLSSCVPWQCVCYQLFFEEKKTSAGLKKKSFFLTVSGSMAITWYLLFIQNWGWFVLLPSSHRSNKEDRDRTAEAVRELQRERKF